MRLSLRTVLFCSILTLAASQASAQNAKRPLGDTLRFKSIRKMLQDIADSPMGPMTNNIDSNGTLVIAFSATDTVRMWIESMTMSMKTAAGDMSPPADMMLNKPWVATLSPDGVFKVVSSPKLVDGDDMGLSSMMDMEDQFLSSMMDMEDQFPFETHMPKGALTKGMVWTDTIAKKSPPGGEQQMSGRTIARNTVVGDSIVYGLPVVIIESVADADVDLDMSLGGGQMTMKSKTSQNTVSRKYYSPAYRLSLIETATGTGTGTQTIEGPMSMTMNSKQKVEASTTLIR